jgi:hypothetical protein
MKDIIEAGFSYIGLGDASTYNTARAARKELKIPSDIYEAAHIIPTVALLRMQDDCAKRGIKISEGRGLAALLDKSLHWSFDFGQDKEGNGWWPKWDAAMHAHEQITVARLHKWLQDAVDAIPMPYGVPDDIFEEFAKAKGKISWMIFDEFYRKLDMHPDFVLANANGQCVCTCGNYIDTPGICVQCRTQLQRENNAAPSR